MNEGGFIFGLTVGGLVALWLWAHWPLVYRAPKAGETWRFKPRKDHDPWKGAEESAFPVTILEVRDGWVRYSMGRHPAYNDLRMKMKPFVYCYAPPAP